jgi:hypothetical protein
MIKPSSQHETLQIPVEKSDADLCGDTISISCDELYFFVEDGSQPDESWEGEPPFVRPTLEKIAE